MVKADIRKDDIKIIKSVIAKIYLYLEILTVNIEFVFIKKKYFIEPFHILISFI
jgi:hypothetical protein